MAASQRPAATVTPAEPASALTIYKKRELAAFTTDDAKALITPKLAPLGVTFEHLMTELYLVIQKTPAIAKCTPASQISSVVRCLEWGLSIGEKAFIVPFKGTATAVRSYQGDIELIVHAGGAKSIDAAAVYEGDAFEYRLGTNAFVNHIPSSKPKKGRKITHGYAVAHIGYGVPPKVVVLTAEEIDAIRKNKSQSWWAVKDKQGNITRLIALEEIEWYAEKTPVHKIAKQLPTNPRMKRLVAQFDEELVTDAVVETAAPATPAADSPATGKDQPNTNPSPADEEAEYTVEDDDKEDGDHAASEAPAAKCPKCGSEDLFDNREENAGRRERGEKLRPDYKCKDKACGGLIWPPRDEGQMRF